MNNPPDALVFRSDIRPLLKLSVIIALLGPAFFLVMLALRGHSAEKPFDKAHLVILAGPSLIGVVIAAISIISRRVSIVVVRPEGLQCYDRRGRDHFIAWGDILSVQPFEPDLGLRYLLISVPLRAESITLPLFLENMPEFIAAVEQYAGRDNALARGLRAENPPA
jgi:hypothetical protein